MRVVDVNRVGGGGGGGGNWEEGKNKARLRKDLITLTATV